MKDRQKIFLNKVTKLLVDDTGIDYDQDRIYFPFPLSSFSFTLPNPFPSSFLFSSYCKYNYGLTKEEIKYVWDQYRSIIKDKISNNER